MPGPDWENLKEIFHSAVMLPTNERAAYLDEACNGDLSLRRRVEELLRSHEETGNFVDTPAYQAAAEMLTKGLELKAGSTVAHYRVLSLLGEGGMGRVYLAEDTKLHRKVSLKFLSADVTKDHERLRRFEQEARAASALNQPNIITIHEIGEEDGHQFIAIEFIDGQTLRERLRSPLDLDESLEIAIQVASALAAAHRVNIVHRDIKPENIMIRKDDGLVKVLDFGLAKMSVLRRATMDPEADTQLRNTAPGVVMGTAAYMSPEQARGETVDERTDIWSLGVVLYEMIAGCSPFVASTSNEIISAILSRETPAPLTRYSRLVPERLEEIVEKALTKNKDERYQTSKDLLIDLKRLQQTLQLKAASERSTSPDRIVSAVTDGQATVSKAETSASRTPQASSAEYIVNQVRSHKRVVLLSLALLLLIAAGMFIYAWRSRETAAPSRPEIKSLAVLPLENLSGDPSQEYFADGMTEALISNLSQIKALKVISRTSVMRYKGSRESLPIIAQALGVDAVIEGSVQRSGGRVRVTAKLVPATTDAAIWSRNYEREVSDILKLQSDVAQAIAAEVRVQLTPDEQNRLASARPIDPKAHEAYLLGRYHLAKLNESDLSRAVDYFKEAIRIEPDFAAAYAGLSRAWSERGIWGGKSYIEVETPAREAARKALQIDPANSSAHTSMCMILINYDFNYSAAEEQVRRAIEIDPGSAEAHVAYGWLLQVLGRYEEVLEQMEKAEQLDPASSQIQGDFGRMLYRARKYDEAEKHLKRSIELDPNNYGSYGRLGDVYIEMGRFGDAVAMFEKSRSIQPQGAHALRLAVVYARMGNRQAALDALTTTSNRSTWELARLYTALGDLDKAFTILNESIDKRDVLLTNLKEDPGFERLHSDPRWKLMLRRLNFPDA
jgi:serine/threonine protein kinase/Tfp pilus assembly protein PilF